MKRKAKPFLVLTILMNLSALVVCPLSWAVKDTIVAIVNDDVITLNDLKNYLSSIALQLKIDGRSASEVKRMMADLEVNGLKKLVQDKLIIATANKAGIKVNDDAVSRRLDEIKGEYKSEKEFLEALLTEGASITDLKNKITDQMKIKFIVEQEVKSKIFVNPQEVNEYFKNHFEEFQKPERLELDSLYVSKGSDPKRTRIKAYSALQAIREGKDFKVIAKRYSQNPSIGMIQKGQMLPEIEDAVFKLDVGEVSTVVEVADGYYIFKVLAKLPKELAELDEVKDAIYNKIFQQKYQQKFNEWLEKIRKDAFIEIKQNL